MPTTSPSLQLSLSVQPTGPLTPAELARFVVELVVVNTGAATVDPQLERSSSLLVNGAPAANWDFTIAGGPRDDRWHALPPGDRLQLTYQVGASLFHGPGRYTLVFTAGGARSAPVTVDVAP